SVRTAKAEVTAPYGLGSRQLHVLAVEAGAGDEAIAAAGPEPQPRLGMVADRFEPDVGKRRRRRGAAAGVLEREVDRSPGRRQQVLPYDGVEGDGGPPRPDLVELG